MPPVFKAKFTTGDIGPMLARKTFPMFLAMLGLTAFNLADTYFVGKLGMRELAAMSFTFPVVMAVISLALGLGTGVSSVVSRAIGQGDHQKVCQLTTDAFRLTAFVTLAVSFLGIIFAPDIFRVLGAKEDIIPLVVQYMDVWFLGMIFVVVPIMGNHIIRATGDMILPAAVMLTASVVNIILDPILIFGLLGAPRLGLLGAALATVISRSISLIVCVSVIMFREKMILFSSPKWNVFWESVSEIVVVAIPATGVNLLVAAGAGITTRLISGFGPAVVAGFGVAYRIEALCLHIYMALCSVTAPFVGQNWGSRQFERIWRALSMIFHFSGVLSICFAVLLAIFARPIIAFFNPDPHVVFSGSMFLWIVPISYGAEAIVMISSTAFNAIGKPITALIMVSLRMVVFLLPLALILRSFFGFSGVFLAVALTNFIVGIGAFYWDKKFFSPLTVTKAA